MSKNINLTDLVSARTLEKIQDNFSEATGISCAIRNLNGELITKQSNPSKLWSEVIKHPAIEKEYAARLLKILNKCVSHGQIEIFPRYMDAHAYVVPIFLEGRVSAFFIGGLTRFGNPEMDLCNIEATKLGIELDAFLEMYLELPIVTEEKLIACANLFKIIASTISSLAKEGTDAKEKVNKMTEINYDLEKKILKHSIELHESEERYKKLFDTINDGVYITDDKGIVKEMNATGAHMLGFEPNEIVGKNLRDLYVNPSDRDSFINELYSEGHIEHFNPYIRLKNGQLKFFETNSTIIRDQYGKITSVQGIFRDIDHRTEKMLQRTHSKVNNTPPSQTDNESESTAIKNSSNHKSPH